MKQYSTKEFGFKIEGVDTVLIGAAPLGLNLLWTRVMLLSSAPITENKNMYTKKIVLVSDMLERQKVAFLGV